MNALDGWLNTDFAASVTNNIVFMDAEKCFPYASNTFVYVFSEQMIEHIGYASATSMLRESYRVLKPGGRIRIATPDLDVLVGLLSSTRTSLQAEYIAWITRSCGLLDNARRPETFVINNAFRNWGHQFLYDEMTLAELLRQIGFIDCVRHSVGNSDCTQLRGLEAHGTLVGNTKMNDFETMVLEASKPDKRSAPGA